MNAAFIKKLSLGAFLLSVNIQANIPLEKQEINYLRFEATDPSLIKDSFFKKKKNPLKNLPVVTSPVLLLKAAQKALAHLKSNQGMAEYNYILRNNYKNLANNKDFHVRDLFTFRAEKTLSFIIETIEEDIKLGRNHRILDTNFLNKHFHFLSWKPDLKNAQEKRVDIPDKKQIRITKYAVFKDKGLPYKTKDYCCALYSFKNESKADEIRFKYTKQQVVDGALERNYKDDIVPLVWLTRNGLEEALLQGTICIDTPGNKQRFFKVDKNNGIAYDQTIKDKTQQKRYWYFKEVEDMENNNSQAYVINHGSITLAGDLANIGIGKLIALNYENPVTEKKEIRLGLLIDTGGAFVNNLYQLDLFAGIFKDRDELFAQTRGFPQYARAYILVKK